MPPSTPRIRTEPMACDPRTGLPNRGKRAWLVRNRVTSAACAGWAGCQSRGWGRRRLGGGWFSGQGRPSSRSGRPCRRESSACWSGRAGRGGGSGRSCPFRRRIRAFRRGRARGVIDLKFVVFLGGQLGLAALEAEHVGKLAEGLTAALRATCSIRWCRRVLPGCRWVRRRLRFGRSCPVPEVGLFRVWKLAGKDGRIMAKRANLRRFAPRIRSAGQRGHAHRPGGDRDTG